MYLRQRLSFTGETVQDLIQANNIFSYGWSFVSRCTRICFLNGEYLGALKWFIVNDCSAILACFLPLWGED